MDLSVEFSNRSLFKDVVIRPAGTVLTITTPVSTAKTLLTKNIADILKARDAGDDKEVVLIGSPESWVYPIVLAAVMPAFERVYIDEDGSGQNMFRMK